MGLFSGNLSPPPRRRNRWVVAPMAKCPFAGLMEKKRLCERGTELNGALSAKNTCPIC